MDGSQTIAIHAWSEFELPALILFLLAAIVALKRTGQKSFLWLVAAAGLLLSFHLPAVHGQIRLSSNMTWSESLLVGTVVHIPFAAFVCLVAFCITQIVRGRPK